MYVWVFAHSTYLTHWTSANWSGFSLTFAVKMMCSSDNWGDIANLCTKLLINNLEKWLPLNSRNVRCRFCISLKIHQCLKGLADINIFLFYCICRNIQMCELITKEVFIMDSQKLICNKLSWFINVISADET